MGQEDVPNNTSGSLENLNLTAQVYQPDGGAGGGRFGSASVASCASCFVSDLQSLAAAVKDQSKVIVLDFSDMSWESDGGANIPC